MKQYRSFALLPEEDQDLLIDISRSLDQKRYQYDLLRTGNGNGKRGYTFVIRDADDKRDASGAELDLLEVMAELEHEKGAVNDACENSAHRVFSDFDHQRVYFMFKFS